MAININDLIALKKLGEEFLVVEEPKAYTKYVDGKTTGEVEGYKYSVVLPQHQFDKIQVKVEQKSPSISTELIEKNKTVSVKFKNLQAFVYSFNNRAGISFKADSIEVS